MVFDQSSNLTRATSIIASPENDEFELKFAEVLAMAEENAWRTNAVLDETVLKDVRGNSMPQIPIWRLHLGATSSFLGIIQCLKTRYSSLGALSLLRGLVESWAHLHFIADETEPGTAAMRAIQFEAGVLSEWASIDKKNNPALDYAETMKRHQRSIMRLWRENGGDGEPRRRKYGDVNGTLEKIAVSPGLDRVQVLHAASSSGVHVGASDFLLKSEPTSVTVTWITPGRRCAWLQLAIMSFDYLTLSALSAKPVAATDAVIQDLHIRWQNLYNSPFLTAVVATEVEEEGSL